MQIIQPHNPGVIFDTLPDDLFEQLKQAVQNRRNESNTFDNPRKQSLQVLSIKEIDDTPYFEEMKIYLINMFKTWCKTFDVQCEKFEIPSVWTNYMKPGEFGPMHKHTPALATFVIWVSVPYQSEKEKHFHYDGKNLDHTNRNGAFEFMYSKYNGVNELHTMELDKNHEGKILMFPGDLYHCVYPFFSTNQERISVAGNFYSLDVMKAY